MLSPEYQGGLPRGGNPNMSKLKGVQSCIIDAQYLADLIEIAADGLETPEGGAIWGAARIAIES